ncbi:MAG: ATP-binding response regulator, partial [bacterium]
MPDPTSSWAERHRDYWESEGRERATSQLVGTCAFVLICQFVFIGLDRLAFPEQFPLFVTMRLAVNLGVVGVLVSWRHHFPNACQIGVALAVALEILVMIYATGESDSLYFAGLIIVLVGIPVLQPISVAGSVLVSSVTVGGFLLCATSMPGPMDERAFLIEMIFILTAALESGMSCHALAVNRVVNFEQRQEIESARDQLASLDEAKTRFTANVHHELRTPLTLILAPLESLRGGDMGSLPEPVLRTLRTMHVNGQRLLKLINNLLDLAKLESDRFTVHRVETELVPILQDIVEGAGPLADRKGVELRLEPSPGLPDLYVNPDALEKVIVNLVGNALKFTDSGGAVTVGVEPEADGNGVRIRVRDTGLGIAREDLDRVFDRFAQADGSATREHEGTGIGLALSKELVELHEGSIWAESEGLGRGTTLVVQLPIGEADGRDPEGMIRSDEGEALSLDESLKELDEKARSRPEAGGAQTAIDLELEQSIDRWEARQDEAAVPSSDPVSSDRPQVVVADDNGDMRELLQLLLSREFTVHVARDGREALELSRRVRPDLVVTDIMMPGMTGTELCQEIKGDPELGSTPVMLVSSKAESVMKIEGLERGADDYVTKPFHPRELLVRARGWVRLRTLQREIEERNTALETALGELKAAEV